MPLTYSVEQAARFLNISAAEVFWLTKREYLTQYRQNRKGYYLGGMLDDIKPDVKLILSKRKTENVNNPVNKEHQNSPIY